MVSSVEVTTECESCGSAPGSTRICQALACSKLASPSSVHGGEGSRRKGTGAARVPRQGGGGSAQWSVQAVILSGDGQCLSDRKM